MPQCKALTNHMCSTVTGSWRPCCRFENFEYFDASLVSFSEYKKSKFYQNIITLMERDWHLGCIKCKHDEEMEHGSLREEMNRRLTGTLNVIESLEFSPSNKCNLACKMCSPPYSTTWQHMVKKNTLDIEITNNKSLSINQVFADVNITNLKLIKYLGGEPFIMPETEKLFKFLDEQNIIQNINFETATNVTVFPKKLLKYLKKFKKVFIEFSIEGIGEVGEYIRYGKSWKIIDKNIKKWLENKSDNMELSTFTTVQAYNIHHIHEIKEYAKQNDLKFYSSVLRVPEFLSINVLPKKYIDKIKNKSNEKYLKQYKENKKNRKEFVSYTNTMDTITNLNIKDIMPYEYIH
jgi:MoaA/NifB/PqqE/SkfB family radical SAM enzyme